MRSSEEGAGAKPRVFDSIVTYLSTITIYTTHHRYKFTHLHHKHTSVFIVYKFKLLSTLLLFIIFTVSPPVARSPPPIPRSQFLLLLTHNDCIHFLIFPSYCLLFFPSFSRNVSFSFLFVPFTFTATLIASSAAQMNISNKKRTKQIFLNEIGYAGLPTTAH